MLVEIRYLNNITSWFHLFQLDELFVSLRTKTNQRNLIKHLRCSTLRHAELLVGNRGSEQLHVSTCLVAKHDILQAYERKLNWTVWIKRHKRYKETLNNLSIYLKVLFCFFCKLERTYFKRRNSPPFWTLKLQHNTVTALHHKETSLGCFVMMLPWCEHYCSSHIIIGMGTDNNC